MTPSVIWKAAKNYFLEPLLDWVYPPLCLLCQKPLPTAGSMICEPCWQTIPTALNASWQSLWLVRNNRTQIYFNGFYSCFSYTDAMQIIIHHLKYSRMTRLAKEIIAHTPPQILSRAELRSCDYIIPVPLHQKRERKRGYNQCTLLAEELSRCLNIPLLQSLLLRTRNTPSQTLLDAETRQLNVRNAFVLINEEKIQQKNLLLIDDLITTGATMNECARALRNGGAKNIYALTIAHPI